MGQIRSGNEDLRNWKWKDGGRRMDLIGLAMLVVVWRWAFATVIWPTGLSEVPSCVTENSLR